MTPSSPANQATARSFGAVPLELKAQHKTELQEKLGWTEEPKRPMICLPTGMTDALGGELLKEVLPGLLSLPIEILILGKGSAAYGSYLTDISQEHKHRVAIIPNTDDGIRSMYAASDIALFLADASTLPELKQALSYGAVPVVPAGSKIKNYDPNQESGEAFVYDKLSPWNCFGALVRALETYRFPFDWKTIQKHGMEQSN